ncbi:hypothetical protein NP493_27g01035 [Ridgeia piscesae]|uniref:Uncharacterized protein n=1 Tax=Ridgeia piscesae TaxID=27915 RepID=A0AAD9PD46_RIDPI|nr:hypothetical protein NP493_27g01035 [Ridgeia piscesae]
MNLAPPSELGRCTAHNIDLSSSRNSWRRCQLHPSPLSIKSNRLV